MRACLHCRELRKLSEEQVHLLFRSEATRKGFEHRRRNQNSEKRR